MRVPCLRPATVGFGSGKAGCPAGVLVGRACQEHLAARCFRVAHGNLTCLIHLHFLGRQLILQIQKHPLAPKHHLHRWDSTLQVVHRAGWGNWTRRDNEHRHIRLLGSYCSQLQLELLLVHHIRHFRHSSLLHNPHTHNLHTEHSDSDSGLDSAWVPAPAQMLPGLEEEPGRPATSRSGGLVHVLTQPWLLISQDLGKYSRIQFRFQPRATCSYLAINSDLKECLCVSVCVPVSLLACGRSALVAALACIKSL